jgi:hypothetical protein
MMRLHCLHDAAALPTTSWPLSAKEVRAVLGRRQTDAHIWAAAIKNSEKFLTPFDRWFTLKSPRVWLCSELFGRRFE